MSERGTRLMVIADSQLSEMIEFFGTLNEVDLHKPYPDESTEDSAGDTVALSPRTWLRATTFSACFAGRRVRPGVTGHG